MVFSPGLNMEKFVVVAETKSGTQFFETVPANHPCIHMYYEVFSSIARKDFHYFWLQEIKEDDRNIFVQRGPEIFDEHVSCIFNGISARRAAGIDIESLPR
jgi:hypothetical protein